ncbi:A24 family peptidase [Arthrobacter sp. AL12]|uniref:prepilin peptidase n=1 Tax=Arthrobacter sp. AL12 TaxID=3042241 RepID=UPI00249A42B1|nr:A24 family peptidase [Arthrobacter sp. AL12]MDI3211511.1 A24 family peptidase [Arthrobacter sp. AL12]
MFETAAAGTASPLFIAGVGLAGACLGLLADALIRRALPQLAGEVSTRLKITTAAVTFALASLLAWRFGSTAELPAYVLLGILAVPLARIDIAHHLLPNRLIGPLLVAGLALLTFAALAQGAAGDLYRGVAGSVILFGSYLILALTSRNGLGMGDVKLAAPLGLYLGYLGWSHLFYGGALAFVAGGVASVVLVLKNRGNRPKEVAYGPSMLAAGLAIILLLP